MRWRIEQETAPAGTARVIRPVDGDTIVVDIEGAEESVRFIGIDTPESVAQDRPVECFGRAGRAHRRAAASKAVVRLERDVEVRIAMTACLAYVIRD